jgi:CRP-like cAMP-binding protein
MIESLRQFDDFNHLDPATLQRTARHCQLVHLPADRWLARAGRTLSGRYYLLRGKIRVFDPNGVLRHAARAIYPGHSGILTLSAVRLLRLDASAVTVLDSALHGTGNGAGARITAAEVENAQEADANCWQVRFLRSHMLSPLSAPRWQQILGALEPVELSTGSKVIRAGERGNGCFILATGRAVVRHRGRVLRELGPGDFFGEDALLSQKPRNATVKMLSDGVVMRLDEAHFRDWLVASLVAEAGSADSPACWRTFTRRETLHVSGTEGLRETLAAADACAGYVVHGPSRVAALAVFLLRQRGIRAVLAQGADVS